VEIFQQSFFPKPMSRFQPMFRKPKDFGSHRRNSTYYAAALCQRKRISFKLFLTTFCDDQTINDIQVVSQLLLRSDKLGVRRTCAVSDLDQRSVKSSLVFCRLSRNQPTGLCFFHFVMIQTYTYLCSSNWSLQRREIRIHQHKLLKVENRLHATLRRIQSPEILFK